MEPIVVSTQAQYDEALKLCQRTPGESRFDIDRDIGMDIVEEVDYLVYNYFCRDATREETEKNLSEHYFTQNQASEIFGYFLTHRPGDLYEIERGLNALNLQSDGDREDQTFPIHIRDSTEKIRVASSVEVFGKSLVEAFGSSKVIAHDSARVIAHDRTIVEAFDDVLVSACDKSHATVRGNSQIFLDDQSTVTAYDHPSITAKDFSKVALFDSASGRAYNNVTVEAYDQSVVFGKDNANIRAFNKANVSAYDHARVAAKDLSSVFARDHSSVITENNSMAIAYNCANVTAKDNSLIFAKDEAEYVRADKALVIDKDQNKPQFFKNSILLIFDHPYINRKPEVALRLLARSASKEDIPAFSRELKSMGCVDPQSTDKAIRSLVIESKRNLASKKERNDSWER
jgi:hypothetical protein